MHCIYCNLQLKREPVIVGGLSYGPVCARNLFGRKPPRVKRERRGTDEATPDLFPLDLRFAELVQGVSLEMDV